MAITKLNSLAIPPNTIVESDLSYPLTNFSSTGIDDNATSTAVTIDASENVGIGTTSPNKPLEISKTGGGAVIRLNNPDSTVSSGESLGSIEWQSNDASTPGGTGTQAIINVIDTNTYGTAYAMTFTTSDSGTTAERMRISSAGNVGIGTTSPAYPLDTQVSSNTWAARVLNTGATDGSGLIVRSDSTNDPIVLGVYGNGSYRLVARANGNVGIGSGASGSLSTALEVSGDSSSVANNITTYNASTASSAEVSVDWALERTGSAAKIRAARISAGKEQTWTTTGSTVDGYLKFLTVRDESLNEAMRINALGGVYLGTTGTTIGSGNLVVNEGVYVGAANGDYQIRSSSSGGGSATLYIGNAAIQVSSDRRLKENIVDTSMSALDKLDQVRVVDFTWNDPSDTAVNNRNARGTWTGIIAQELVDVFPFAVNAPRNEDDLTIDEKSESTWQVDQDQLVPVLIKAIQELKAEVAALKGA